MKDIDDLNIDACLEETSLEIMESEIMALEEDLEIDLEETVVTVEEHAEFAESLDVVDLCGELDDE